MNYNTKTIKEILLEYINRNTFLPAIQREYVWNTLSIEKLFDSIMDKYPISTFLFWKIREENKKDWVSYGFINDFDKENPHNNEANLSGVNQDIYLVLDGQQRLTSLYIGLKGTYSYFHYKKRKTKLYLNLLKQPIENENPEELTYQFKFRENDTPDLNDDKPQFWYLVGDILDYEEAEDAKDAIKEKLSYLTDEEKNIANTCIGKLHARIHTDGNISFYEEKTQDYNKIVEIFIRANTGGVKLGYSDILLSTATAKWNRVDARKEIPAFTDEINTIGNGYSFEKDFVLKACLYLTDGLDIAYKLKNFTKENLDKIENNWDEIKRCVKESVEVISCFGFSDKNLIAKLSILPIALYIKQTKKKNFSDSTQKDDIICKNNIQKWLVLVLLKGVFGGSSDTTLKHTQEVINKCSSKASFPCVSLNKKLGMSSSFSPDEMDRLLGTGYGTKNSYLILSLLYPDRDWTDKSFQEDHIYPKSEFTRSKLNMLNYEEQKINNYLLVYNTILNLELLTNSENNEKRAKSFDKWIETRDVKFKKRHTIPQMSDYSFDNFIDFVKDRKRLIETKLQDISFDNIPESE